MMKKYLLIINIIIIFTSISVLPAFSIDVFAQYDKVIWINQHKQIGVAYEGGQKVWEFPVLTGDDETTTNPGIYVVRRKDDSYYSRKYDTWMPYSIFFDLKNRKALHEGVVPSPKARKAYATHGCIHVESPYIERLYNWTDEGTTVVVIQGWRDED
jgi:lipoprotein-anchoring transpeptidase ErfK/SrfK